MADNLALRRFIAPAGDAALIEERLSQTTFVGIDFGTSTTVASYAVLGDREMPIRTERLAIQQPLADGRVFKNHLVPTSVAWYEDRLLFGEGARRLAPALVESVDYWSSFKMQLGFDLGPQFFASKLGQDHPEETILTPVDAAAVFFRFLKQEIVSEVGNLGLPERIQYSVSIPASFEANQRRDLVTALGGGGIPVADNVLVDEPNAAFLSYLAEANSNELGSLMVPASSGLHALVFDFGAGTCDISVLEIRSNGPDHESKNLAISRFESLGGDNIDRIIAKRVLLPQLEVQNGVESRDWRTPDLKKRIIPSLKPIAEQLKIKICKGLAAEMHEFTLPDFVDSEEEVSIPRSFAIELPRSRVHLVEPTMSFTQFRGIVDEFVDPDGSYNHPEDDDEDAVFSVFEPTKSALRKARLGEDDIDMALLVGGSSENPHVQAALAQFFSNDSLVVPTDLRSLVSKGAALNSFLVNGLGAPIVRPITSEPILILTRDQDARVVVPAGTEMPSRPFEIGDLRVQRDGQDSVEIPVCVGGPDKILSVIEVPAKHRSGFSLGAEVRVVCRLSEDKLLNVEARIDGEVVEPEVISPFANRELTTVERKVFEAEKEAYVVTSANGGRPTASVLARLAEAYGKAGRHKRAAETLETLNKLQPESGQETDLCYHWSRAGRPDLSTLWARKAYEADLNEVSAYNLALSEREDGDEREFERLLSESLDFDSEFSPALWVLGRHLDDRDDPEGLQMINRARRELSERLDSRQVDVGSCSLLVQIARYLNDDQTEKAAERCLDELRTSAGLYDPDNLLVAKGGSGMLKKGA